MRQTTTRHYDDTSDNPAWVTTADATGTSTTRFAESLGGDLGLTLTNQTGGPVTGELTLADPHGDVVTTVPLPASGAATGISAWTDNDEYGVSLSGAPPATGGVGYGWLGAKQRATTGSGLMLMGARVYNPTTGQFTSTDPEFGGGETAYGYPTDPINAFDLNGQWWSWTRTAWHDVRRHWGTYLSYGAVGACVFATAGLCGIATVATIAYSGYSNYRSWRSGRTSGWHAAASFGYDAVGYRFRALRSYRARHLWGSASRWVSSTHRIVRSYHPWRYAARAAYNAGSAYKTYRAW